MPFPTSPLPSRQMALEEDHQMLAPHDPMAALAQLLGVNHPSVPAAGSAEFSVAPSPINSPDAPLPAGEISVPGSENNDSPGLDELGRPAHEAQIRHDQMSSALSDFFLPDNERARAEGLDASLAPERLKGEYGLAEQRLKNQGAETIAGMKTQSAGAGGDDPTVSYWADQAMRDNTVLSKLPMKMRADVEAKMAGMGGDTNAMTNQTRQMSEAANDLLPMISQIEAEAEGLKKDGLFDLAVSPMRQFFVRHGMGTVLGYGDDAAARAARFQTNLGLLQSGVARAHAGARGAGNTGMAERFERLMNAGGDVPTFLGELTGVRDLMTIYAQHTNPGVGQQQSAPAGNDSYANPDYQPR